MRITNLVFLLFLLPFYGHTQFSVIADGLDAPAGIQTDVFGNHWVAESGTGANDGRIIVIKRNGDKETVITGLPSFFSTATRDVRGAWRTFELPDNKVAVIIGEGPSPEFGRILIFNFRGFRIGHSAPKTPADAIKSIDITSYALSLDGVNDSNPYSMATDHWGNMYVADAGANRVFKVDKRTSEISVFAVIPPSPNPLPFGPPVSDAVPTKIISKGFNSFYLAELTGFPFAPGAAKIYEIDFKGSVTTFATGLTTITDLARDKRTGDLYALQFGAFGFNPFPGFAQGSSKISRINSAGGNIQTVAEDFGPASGLGLDGRGNILVTELGQGRLLQLTGGVPRNNFVPNELPNLTQTIDKETNLSVFPNPVSDVLTVKWNNQDLNKMTTLRVTDVSGRIILEQANLATFGTQRIDVQNLNPGMYLLQMNSAEKVETKKIIVRR